MPRPPKCPRSRRLALEPLEPRAVPTTALYVQLDVGARPYIEDAALMPDGGIRIVGSGVGEKGTVWDFGPTGDRLNVHELPVFAEPGRHARVKAVSPDGSWIGGTQYDFDYTPGHVYDPASTRWDGSNLDSFIRIDTTLIPDKTADVLGIANNGDILFWGENYTAFLWSPTTGMHQLPPLPIDAEQDWWPYETRATAISADGSTIVGSTGRGFVGLPTVWTSSGPAALPSNGKNGSAYGVSGDGHIVGGSLTEGNSSQAVVWIDGSLVPLKDESGQPAAGSVGNVANNIGGDPDRWVAFGDTNGQPWISFSDGITHPLNAWLSQHYDISLNGSPNLVGLSVNEGLVGVLGCFINHDNLELIVTGATTVGFAGWSPIYAQTSASLIVAPLNSDGTPADEHPFDVNGDGALTPSDVLVIINALNDGGAGPIAEHPDLLDAFPRIDVNSDGQLSPSDALLIINILSAPTQTSLQLRAKPVLPPIPIVHSDGESAASPIEGEPASVDAVGDLFAPAADDLFTDLAARRRK